MPEPFMDWYYVLTFEYFDKSGFKVCGITQNVTVADTWKAAGEGQHKVYRMTTDKILSHTTGYEEYDLQGATPPF